MSAHRAKVHGGRLVLDEPTALPEGSVLDLVLDDEGDDLDDKSDKFDLRDGDDDTVDFEFSIPYNLGEGQYKATVKAEGSVKTQKFTDNVEFYFEVEKEKHDVVLQKAQFVSPTVECSRNTAIEIKVLNLGNTDEDEVKLDVTSTELGISEKAKFDLDEATGDDGDDYDYAKSIPLEIKEELKAGKYPVSITVYYENSRVADSKIITLNVADCEEKSGKTEIVSAHQPGSVEQAVSTIAGKGSQDDRVVESRFRDSSLYTTLLISGGIILLGAVIFAAGAVIILSKKGKL